MCLILSEICTKSFKLLPLITICLEKLASNFFYLLLNST